MYVKYKKEKRAIKRDNVEGVTVIINGKEFPRSIRKDKDGKIINRYQQQIYFKIGDVVEFKPDPGKLQADYWGFKPEEKETFKPKKFEDKKDTGGK